MPQVRKIDDEAVLERLALTFKDVGYEGASLALLSEATGLKKSSLYHRFPDGKAQMALEVMARTARTLDEEVFPLLEGDDAPKQKLAAFAGAMDAFYASGRQSCLLNMLAPPRDHEDPCGQAIEATFQRLLGALKIVAREAGATPAQASERAERVLVELQGALVVARGMKEPAVFERALLRVQQTILSD